MHDGGGGGVQGGQLVWNPWLKALLLPGGGSGPFWLCLVAADSRPE